MKKILAVAALAMTLGATLSGCMGSPQSPQAGPDSGTLRFHTVELPDGGVVECVGSYYASSAVAPDCNWKEARSTGSPSEDHADYLRSYALLKDDDSELYCVASIFSSVAVIPDCDWDGESQP